MALITPTFPFCLLLLRGFFLTEGPIHEKMESKMKRFHFTLTNPVHAMTAYAVALGVMVVAICLCTTVQPQPNPKPIPAYSVTEYGVFNLTRDLIVLTQPEPAGIMTLVVYAFDGSGPVYRYFDNDLEAWTFYSTVRMLYGIEPTQTPEAQE